MPHPAVELWSEERLGLLKSLARELDFDFEDVAEQLAANQHLPTCE